MIKMKIQRKRKERRDNQMIERNSREFDVTLEVNRMQDFSYRNVACVIKMAYMVMMMMITILHSYQ